MSMKKKQMEKKTNKIFWELYDLKLKEISVVIQKLKGGRKQKWNDITAKAGRTDFIE